MMRRSWLALVVPLVLAAAAHAQVQVPPVEQEPPILWLLPDAQSIRPPEVKKPKDQFKFNSTGNQGFGTGRIGKKFGERMLGRAGRDLDAYGNWVLTLRSSQVSGSDAARQWFNYQNNNTYFNTSKLGPFQQQLDVTMLGSIFGALKVNTSLTNNRIASQTSLAQLLGFEYENASKTTKAAFGDVNANLPGNELVTFSRRLIGVQYDRQLGGGRSISTVASITRALTRRGSLQGQGTTGPYYLNASQIVPGSEKVFLNGQPLNAYEDYELDYILGTIRFKKSRIINREDTVEFTYEAQNYNTTAGVLTGLRVETPTPLGIGKTGRVGVTMLKQTSGASNTAGRPITQYFPVSSDVSSRYSLASPIKPNTAVQVRYQETLLVEGVNADYIINRDLNYIQLRRALPADTALLGISSLSVSYTPIPQQGVGGDRDVLGLDSQFSPTRTSRVNVQFGQSKGLTSAVSGTGLIVNATLGSSEVGNNPMVTRGSRNDDEPAPSFINKDSFQKRWSANIGWRNIAPGFTSIESTATALLRAEKGLRGAFSFSPSPSWDYAFSVADSSITSQTGTTGTSSTTTTPTAYKNRSTTFGVNWTPPASLKRRLPRVRFDRRDTVQGSGSNTATFTSDGLTATYDIPKGSIESSLSRTSSKGRSIFAFGYTDAVGTGSQGTSGGFLGGYRDGTAGNTTTNSSSESAQLRINLTPSSRLSLSSSVGLTKSNLAGGNFSGRDLSFSVTYSPIAEKLQIQADVSDTSNGQSVSGFYNPNSTIGGSSTVLGGASTGQRTRQQNIRLTFTPTDRLRIEGGRNRSLSLIPNYDNTESTTTDFTLDYALNPLARMTGQWSQQGVTYTGNQGNSDNRNYILQATLGPYKRMGYVLSGGRMNYGSAFSNLGSTSGIGGLGGLGSGLNSGLGQQGLTDTLVARANYSVARSQPFLEWRLLNSHSPQGTGTTTGTVGNNAAFHSSLNYRTAEARIGVEWGLSELLAASFDVRLIHLIDRDTPQFSYRAHMLNFDIKARFN